MKIAQRFSAGFASHKFQESRQQRQNLLAVIRKNLSFLRDLIPFGPDTRRFNGGFNG
jgi:hypothetical protein